MASCKQSAQAALILTILMSVSLLVHAQDIPMCANNPDLQDFGEIYTAYGETLRLQIEDYFTGYNLSYSLILPEVQQKSQQSSKQLEDGDRNITVSDSIQFINSNQYRDQEAVIGVSSFRQSDGRVVVTRFSRQFQFEKRQYNLWFGSGDEESAPVEPVEIELTIKPTTVCFDVALLSNVTIVLDCATPQGGEDYPFTNEYYVINQQLSRSNINPQILENYYVFQELVERKSLAYHNGGVDFLIQGVFFDDLVVDVSSDQTYLNVMRHNPEPQELYPGGTLVLSPPITQFQFRVENLQLADFAILDEQIFALDNIQGVFIFQYYADEVHNVRRIWLKDFDESIQHAWGIAANWDGGYVQLTLATDTQIQIFRIQDLENDKPTRIAVYDLSVTLVSRPELQSNAKFITCQIGELLYVFAREPDLKYSLKGVLESTQQHLLFDTNYVYIFEDVQVDAYLLQKPSLDIQSLRGDDAPDDEIAVWATSTLFGESEVCEINFNLKYVDSGTRKAYQTFRNRPLEYEFSADAPTRDVYLDTQYVGANLRYSIGLTQNTNDDTVNPTLEFSVPELVTFKINEATPEFWSFNKMIAETDKFYQQLHQNNQTNQLAIYSCEKQDALKQVICRRNAVLPFDGRIVEFALGYWQKSYVFAIVLETSLSQIQFFNYALERDGIEPLNFGDQPISQIALSDNLLTLVKFYSQIEVWAYLDKPTLLATLNTAYVSTWKLISSNWRPTRLQLHVNYPNIVIVALRDETLFISTHSSQPSKVASVKVPYQVTSYEPILTARSLFLFTYIADDSKVALLEYSLQNLAKPEFIKNLEFYDYELYLRDKDYQDPVQTSKMCVYSVSNYTGNFYLLAFDPAANYALVILGYRSNNPSVNALHSVVRLNVTKADLAGSIVDIAADGRANEDYVYVTAGGYQYLAYFPAYSKAFLTPGSFFPSNRYTQALEFKYQVTSLDGNTQKSQLEIVFVNKQYDVYLNELAVQNSGITGQGLNWTEQPGNTSKFDVDVTDWYSGPVLGFKLACANCVGVAGTDKYISLANRVNNLTSKDVDFSQIQSLDFVEGGFYVETSAILYILDEWQITRYNQNLRQQGSAIQLQVQHTAADRCYQLIGGRDAALQVLQYAAAICQVSQQWIVSVVDFTNDAKPVAIKPILIPDIVEFGGAQFIDGKLLVLNLDFYESRIYVYDIVKDIKAENTIATEITSFGSDNPQFSLYLNISSFEVVQTDESYYRMLFLMSYNDLVLAVGVYADNYTIIENSEGAQAIDVISAVDLLQNYHQYILPTTVLQTLRVTKYEYYADTDGQGFSTFVYRTLIMTQDTALYEIEWEFESITGQNQKRLVTEPIPSMTFGDYGTDTIQKFITVLDDYFAVSYYNSTKKSYVVAVYYQELSRPTRRSLIKNIGDIKIEPPFVSMIGGQEWLEVQSIESIATLPFLLYKVLGSGKSKQQTLYRMLLPSPFEGLPPNVFQLNYQNITFNSEKLIVRKQDFLLTPKSDFFKEDQTPIEGNFSNITERIVPPTPPPPDPPAPQPPMPDPTKPYCSENLDMLQFTQLYIAYGERSRRNLDDYFIGYNLSYTLEFHNSVNPAQSSVVDTVQDGDVTIIVSDSIQLKNAQIYLEKETIIGVSQFRESSGQVYVTRFSRVYKLEERIYNLWLGQGNEESAPIEPQEIELDIDQSITCYGVTLLTEKIVALDCVMPQSDQKQPYTNQFFIIDTKLVGGVNGPQELNNFYNDKKTYKRKSLAYHNGGTNFLVHAVLFNDGFANQTINTTYINVMLHKPEPVQGFSGGTLVQSAPITDSEFGVSNLRLADFTVLDKYIFAIDNTQGMFVFEYYGDLPRNMRRIQFSDFDDTTVRAWGIAANWDGGYVQITLATDTQVNVYRIQDVYNDRPTLISTFDLPITLSTRPTLQSNAQYTTCQIGEQLYIWTRERDLSYTTKGVLQNAQQYLLFDTNYVYVFEDNSVASYLLQRPSLDIQSAKGERDQGDLIYAIATSTMYGNSVQCQVNFFSDYVANGTREEYLTFRPTDTQYEFEPNAPTRDVYLDTQYVGADLRYSIGKPSKSQPNQQALSDDQDEEVDPSLVFLVPEVVNAIYTPDESPSQWTFNYVLAATEKFYQILHQRNDTYDLVLYSCYYVSRLGIAQCVKQANHTFDSPIIGFSEGYWRNNYVFAITVQSNLSQLMFFNDALQSDDTQTLNFGDDAVTEIALSNNLLTIVRQKSFTKFQLEVWVYLDKPTLLSVVDSDYVSTWELLDPWRPLRLQLHVSYPNIAFVKLRKETLLISTHSSLPSKVASIVLPFDVTSYEPILTARSLFLFTYDKNTESSMFLEYSLQNLAQPQYLKSLELYDFELYLENKYYFEQAVESKVSVYSVANYTGNLYVLAFDPAANYALVVLGYRSNNPSVNALHRAVRLTVTKADLGNAAVDIAADGRADEDCVYVTAGGKQFIVYFPADSKALITPGSFFPYNKYSEGLEFKYEVTALNGHTQKTSLEIVFVNKQYTIYINEAAVNNSGIRGQGRNWTEQPGNTSKFDIDVTNWSDGPVLGFKLTCASCVGVAGTDKYISLANRVNNLTSKDVDLSQIKSLDYVEGGFYLETEGLIYILNDWEITRYNQKLQQQGSAIQLTVKHSDSDRCYQLVGGRDENLQNLQYVAAICNVSNQWIASAVDVRDDNKPVSASPIKLPDLKNFGGAQFIDGKLLVLNVDAQDSHLYVYDLVNDIKGKKSTATLLIYFGNYNPILNIRLNISSFEVTQTDDPSYRILFLTSYYDLILAIGIDAKSYNIITDDEGDEAVDLASAVDILQYYHQYILSTTPLQSLRITKFEKYSAPGLVTLIYRTILLTQDTAIYELEWEFQSTIEGNQRRLVEEPIPSITFGDYGSDNLQKFVAVLDDYFAVSYYNATKQSYVVTVYNQKLEGVRAKNRRQVGDFERDPPFANIIGGQEWLGVTTTQVVATLPFVLYKTQSGAQKNRKIVYRMLLPSPFEGQPPNVFELNEQNITFHSDKVMVKRQDFLLTPISDFFSDDQLPIRGDFSDITERIVPPTPPPPDPPAPQPPTPDPTKPYCSENLDMLQFMQLYTAFGERSRRNLDDYFIGYNLSYTLLDSVNPAQSSAVDRVQDGDHTIIVSDSIQLKNAKKYLEKETIIGVSQFRESSGQVYVTRFSRIYQFEERFYNLFLGQGDEESAPIEPQEIELDIDQSITCYGVTLLTEKIVALDCVMPQSDQKQPYTNQFFIIDTKLVVSEKKPQELNNFYNDKKTYKRKSLAYHNGGTNFLVHAVLFNDGFANQTINTTYINVMLHKPEPVQGFSGGTLVQSAPITDSEFGVSNLRLADFTVLDKYIFAIDNTQGMFVFEYYGDLPRNMRRIQFSDFDDTTVRAWGIAANWDGGYVQITLATDTQVNVYRIQDVYNDRPTLISTFDLPITLSTRPTLQSNAQYTTCQIGEQLYIWTRERDLSYTTKGVLQNAQQYLLFDTNYVYIFEDNSVASYLLQRPSLDIQSAKGEESDTELLYAIATSTMYGNSVQCQVNFYSDYVANGTRDEYLTFRPTDTQYEFEPNAPTRDVYLDTQYVGADLRYSIGKSSKSQPNQQALSDDQDEQVDPTLVFQVPEVVNAIYTPVESPSQWTFNYVLAATEKFYQILHQRNDTYDLVLYSCYYVSRLGIKSAQCVKQANHTFDSPIIGFSEGYWRNNYVFAITVETNLSQLMFFNDALQSDDTQTLNFGEDAVTEIALSNNLLTIVRQKSFTKFQLEVWVYLDKPTLLSVVDSDYVSTWELLDPWRPLRLQLHVSYPNIAFVKLRKETLLISTHSSLPSKVASIVLPFDVTSYEPILTARSLFLFTYDKNTESSMFLEYSLQNLAQPQYLKSLELYDFELYLENKYYFEQAVESKVSVYSVANYTGNLYVLAFDPAANYALVVLGYRSNNPSVNALHRAVRLTVTKADLGNAAVDIAADGRADEDCVYVTAGGKQFIVYFPADSKALITPGSFFPYNKYSKGLEFKYEVTALNGHTEKTSLEIVFVNKQYTIYINETAVNKSGIRGQGRNWTEQPGNTSKFDVDVTNWSDGPVLGFKLTCASCVGVAGTDKYISLANRVNNLTSKDVDLSQIKSLDYVEGGFYLETEGLIYILNNWEITRYNQKLQQQGSAIQLTVKHSDSDRCYQLVGGRDENLQNLQYVAAICNVSNQWIASAVDVRDDNKPVSASPIKLPDLKNFGGAQFIDGKLLVLNLDAQDSHLYVYDLVNDIKGKKSTATLLTYFGKYNPILEIPLNISSFEVTQTDDPSYRILFLTSYYDLILAIGIDAKSYQIIADDEDDEAVDLASVVEILQYYHQYILSTTPLQSLRITKFEKYSAPGLVTLIYRTILLTQDTAIYELQWEFQSTGQGNQRRLADEPVPLMTFGDYGSDNLQKFVAVLDDYFAVSYYNATKQSYVVTVYNQNLKGLSEKNTRQVGNSQDDPPFANIIGGQEWLGVTTTQVVATLPFVLYTTQSDTNQTVYRMLLPSPFEGQSPNVFELNYQNITFHSDKVNVKRQDFLLTPISDFFSDDQLPIRGDFSDITIPIVPPTPPTPPTPPPYPTDAPKRGDSQPQVKPGETKSQNKQTGDGRPLPPTNNSQKKSDTAWIVVDSIIIGLLILGVIAIFVIRQWKNTKNMDDEESIMNLNEEGQIPANDSNMKA